MPPALSRTVFRTSAAVRRPRVVLVHDWLTGMRGGEKCLELACRRWPDARLYALLHRRGSVSEAIERLNPRTSPLQWLPGAHAYYRNLLPCFPWAVNRLRLPADADVVLSFSHAVAKGASIPPGVPHLCYCFTPMRYAWHRRGDYVPSGGTWWGAAAERMLDRLQIWDAQTAENVTHFLAISRTVQDRIRECYGRESEVIYPPVDTEFFRPANVPREDFYLCVSALVPYKRLDLAIDACGQLGRKLVIIGSGPEGKRLARRAGSDVTWLGWQSREQIRDYLRRCRGLLFPGVEDFGIVPVEAQACGTPVIALGEGGATETVLPADDDRIGTGVFFPEPSSEALCAAMEWLEAHPWSIDPGLCRAQALRFGTARYERELFHCVEQAALGRLGPFSV